VDGFVFDVDGVIADTARLHLAAWRRIAEEEGLSFDERVAGELRGLSREASLRRLLDGRQIPPEEFAEITRRKNAYYLAAVESLGACDALPGAEKLVRDLARLGIRCAAASASRNARAVLERVGVRGLLEAVIDGNDEAASKTGLHRFLLAAAAVGVEPGRCVVVEDSAAGAATARSLGMRVVGVGDPAALCAATLVFESLRGVDARILLKWLGAARSPSASLTTIRQ